MAAACWIAVGCSGEAATATRTTDRDAGGVHAKASAGPVDATGGFSYASGGVPAMGGVSEVTGGIAATGGSGELVTGGASSVVIASGGSGDLATGGSGNVQQAGGSGAGGSTAQQGVGGSSGAPDRCSLPMWSDEGLSRSCDGLMWRYWHNPATGFCQLYFYGGCGASANSFMSWRECVDTCGGQDPSIGLQDCTAPADCVAANPFCMGTLCSNPLDEYVGINRQYLGELQRRLSCSYEPMCPYGSYGATCQDGVCVTFNIWKSDLSACDADSDCALRYGVGCCEDCGGFSLVAVNQLRWEPFAESCRALGLDCGPCGSYPATASARCSNSHCFPFSGG